MSTATTQSFVPVKEVRDGIIILKDGSMRAVVMVSSINFALKSQQEQEAIIYQFQNFLNSLEFSTQISIQSRELDIRPYLASLEKQYNEQLNDLLKIQIKEYIAFVKNFTENTNIMTKTFFIVISYSPTLFSKNASGGFLSKIFGNKDAAKKTEGDVFGENRIQVEQRINIIIQGLSRCGLRGFLLGTEEVIELLHRLFNPGETEKPTNLN
jgi:type IV secretory pathway VirB4 component